MQTRCFHAIFYSLFFFTAKLLAQQPVFKSYSFKEGLNTYGINKTIQDEYGFIWIATQDGIYRFNGKSFEVLKNNIAGEKTTSGNFFFDINAIPGGKIYAADFNKGIDMIDPLSLNVAKTVLTGGYANKGQLPNLWLKKIFFDKYNTSWIGGRDFIAYKTIQQQRYIVLDSLVDFKGSLNVLFIHPISDQHIAVGISGYGIVIFNTGTQQIETVLKNSGAEKNNAFAFAKDILTSKDTTFVITEDRVIKGKFTGAEWQWYADYVLPKLNTAVVNCFVKDKQNEFWAGTNSGLVNFNLYTGKFNFYTANPYKKRWLQDNTINHLLVDKENNLWISTSKVLQMISLKPNGIRYFSGDDSQSDPMDHVYSLVKKSETEIFATGTDGLYLTNLISGITKKVSGSSSLGVVHYIEKLTDDFWIVSCDLGMFGYIPSTSVLSQQELLKRYPEWTTYKERYFNNAFRLGNISYWASEEQEGLFKWDIENHTISQYKNGSKNSAGLAENHIHNIKKDRAGFLWLLTDNTLEKFDYKKDTVIEIIRDVRKEKSTAGIFFDMYDDGKKYWFGTFGGGLNSYATATKQWTQITEKDGLCNNTIYGILPESDSILWVSTNMGISRYNIYTKACYNYYYEDGLQDNSFDEKGYLQVDKKLYFGGINGFTEIDTDKMSVAATPPPVYIYKLEYYGNAEKQVINNLFWNKLTLPSGTNTVIIHLAALRYAANNKIKFSYKIEGLQNDFIEINENNTITLNALSYGRYNIVIGYRNDDGSFVNNAAQLNLYISPKWYQTWWFKLLILLTATAIIYAFYRYRIRQIEKQHAIRKNIATDLHDDLGSTLNSVKVFTNLAISGIKQEESLQQVKDNLTEATMSLRDMIWVLDDSLDTVDELVTRIKQFAIPVSTASNMEAIIKADSEVNNRQLTKEEKRNLFLICKEAINNSIKYSGATQINVNITAAGKKIQILISDNGKGFNVDEVKKGYGLKNMQYRAGQIKYTVELTSIVGDGTRVKIMPV